LVGVPKWEEGLVEAQAQRATWRVTLIRRGHLRIALK
jgi:hypothetical protein